MTSAVKFYDKAVYYLIQQFAEGIFPGGSSVMFDLALGGIGLPPSNPGLSAVTLSILEEINRFIKNNELIIPALGEFPVVTPVPIPSLLPTP